MIDGRSTYRFELDMSHTGLGALDESSTMLMLGTCHSRYLTEGFPHKPSEIMDAKDYILYPAYFMTYLVVPPQLPINSMELWDKVAISVNVRQYGDTILDSSYTLKPDSPEVDTAITMQANSLFIHDPSIYRSQDRQVSAPRADYIRKMERLSSPPLAIQESARIRTEGFESIDDQWLVAEPFKYRLKANRDTSPNHPMVFAKFPLLMELAERHFLERLTGGRVAEDLLHDISLLRRKIFYYGNAFAGNELVFYTKGKIAKCNVSLWRENPRMQYLFNLHLQTEIYKNGELLAVAQADKVIVKHIRDQSAVQDAKRLFSPLST